ncbi:hypothetical protein [Sneathiella sp.]|uniref:hypothetical protein n=1 Tax=Sneathiella sp. TaxID=1964365 RepID=UPI0025F1A038|nr:hypothetical protein [Sneathiella sp.]
MTSFRNNSSLLLAVPLLAGGLLMSSATVWAQGKPLSLVPPLGQTTDERAKDSAPPQTQREPDQKNVIEGPGVKGAVVIQSLGGIDPGSIGILTEANGGFGPRIWQGTAPAQIVSLLRQLPVSAASPEMQQLFRRLLLTAAVIPQGLEDPTALLALRLNRLLDAGLVTDAAELIARIPASEMTPSLERVAVEIDLLRGAAEAACQRISGRQSETADGFWTRVDIFCNLQAGNLARAEIGLNLLDEAAGEDPMFLALFDRLAGGAARLPENDQALTPLHIAMMKQAGIELSYSVIENAGYAFLWALAQDETAKLDERFPAAYRSFGVGSVPAELPRRLIREGAFRENGDTAGELGHMAALYREMTSTTPEAERRRIVSELWAAGDRDGSYLAAARLAVPPFLMVSPSDEDEEFAINALRVSLLTGEQQNATAWERMIRRGSLKGDYATREAARIRIARANAYMLISGIPGIARWNAATFEAGDFSQPDGGVQNENAGLYLGILEALGESVPETLWRDVLEAGQAPRLSTSNIVIEKNLQVAAAADRVGETIALALAALGEDGPAMTSTHTLVNVLAALRSIGLEAEARRLALEAAVSRNL